MGATRQLFALAWRESRTARRRLLLYMSSISLGVAALVAIDSFSKNVIRSVREQSRALTGGDVIVEQREGHGPRAQSLLDSLERAGYGVTRSTNVASMALVPRSGGTRLIQLRAVAPGYPFYGTIVTDPAPAWGALQSGRNAIVDPALLVSLDAHLGDTLTLGNARFVITGSLTTVPGDVGISAAIGPRVYVADRYLDETGLLAFGSRAEYQTLLKLNGTIAPDAFVTRFRRTLLGATVPAGPVATSGSVRTAGANESRLASAIDSLHDYLAVVGLVALLLGGIGVASGVHAFVMRKIDPVAILRCLGATSWQVLAIYTSQAALMGLVGALAGAALGIGIQFMMPRAFGALLPVDVEMHLEPAAIGLGLGVGVWVALIFALNPLVALRQISPLQALRRESDAEALKRRRRDPLRILISVLIAASVLALGLSRANTVGRGIGFTVAIGVAIGTLWATAALLSWAARRMLRPGWPFVVRQGIASLYRPGNQTRAVVLALGFGVFLMGTLYQVQQNLLRTMTVRLDEARANVVFFDVQDRQLPGVDSIVRAHGSDVIDETPIIPMRIAAINGRSTSSMLADSTRRRQAWPLRREFRSTSRDTLVASEQIVAGRWFAAGLRDRIGEVSLDRDIARDMRVALGDTITWNVQGVLIPTRVASLREVKWASFAPNFFAVFDSRTLSGAPKQFVILAHSADSRATARLQRDVVARYPTVSSLDLTLVQQTITSVLGKVTTAIRFLALISLTLGIPVLFSAVSATRRERLREGVLLKTLGATRRQIGRIMLAEYMLLGALGATAGGVLSTLAGWALMHWIFKSPFSPAIAPTAVVACAMIGLSVTIGLLTGRDVFAQTPMAALRES
jgi:putative ABC transport system permease protein